MPYWVHDRIGAQRAAKGAIMRRYVLLVALVLAFSMFWGAGSTLAAADDDDIPGGALALGSSVSQSVSSGDVNDVYAIDLTAGEEVHIRCDPGTTSGPRGSFYLLVPGASSITSSDDRREIGYTLSGGSFIRFWADYDYIPAKSGTYYLWVEWETGTLNYQLSVTRTARAPLNMAAESDDIPGTAIGSGTVTGVVSSKADPDDVYAVGLTAGQPVTIRLLPLTPYNNSGSSLAYLSLLDPSTLSISNYYGHQLGERVMAKNNKDPASRETAEIHYTPTQTGTYYIWVEPNPYGYNFAYWLEVSGGGTPEPQDGFPDVSAFHPYYVAIIDLASRGIINGKTDGSFWPDAEVTRQQFAKMIVNTLGISPNASTATRFSDLGSPDAAGYPHIYVQAAYDNGITTGTNLAQTLFAPTNPIQRDQMVSMIVRGARSIFPGTLEEPPAGTPSLFAGVGAPHGTNLRIAEYNGLLDGLVGMDSGWDVFANATRGEVAQVLWNLLAKMGD
jgi:hypothetical protein